MEAHVQSPSMKRLCKTNLACCPIHAMDQRKEAIFNNSTMLAAIYLDPRYRNEILHNESLVKQAKQMLINIWRRLVSFRPELANKSIINCSNESTGINLSINDCGLSIEREIELFQPDKISYDYDIISYWLAID